MGNQSNSVDIVRRTVSVQSSLSVPDLNSSNLTRLSSQAFNLLLNLHVLFNPATDLTPIEKRDNIYSVPEELELTLDEQVQWRCAGFMQAEIEKYAEEKVDLTASQLEVGSDEEMDDEDDDAPPKKKGGKKKEDFSGFPTFYHRWPRSKLKLTLASPSQISMDLTKPPSPPNIASSRPLEATSSPFASEFSTSSTRRRSSPTSVASESSTTRAAGSLSKT